MQRRQGAKFKNQNSGGELILSDFAALRGSCSSVFE